MTNKPAPPPAAAEWLKHMRAPAPRCCHTCDYYLSNGLCYKFNQAPPDEFTQTLNACDQWDDIIPF